VSFLGDSLMIDERSVERRGAFFGGMQDDDADTPQSDVIVWVVIGVPSQIARISVLLCVAPERAFKFTFN